MRSVILLLGLLTPLIFLGAGEARARGIRVPKQHFYASIKTEYSTNWYKVFEAKGKWVCQTHAMPIIEAQGNPLPSQYWRNLESRPFSPGCRQRVQIKDIREKPVRTIEGCFTDPPFQVFMTALASACQP